MPCGLCCTSRLTLSARSRLCVCAMIVVPGLLLMGWKWSPRPLFHTSLFSPPPPVDADKVLRWWRDIPRGQPQWQKVDNLSEAFVYSAHYDDVESPPLIRVIGIALDPLPYFYVNCRYVLTRGGPVAYNVSGNLLHLRERNGRRYLAAYIECPLDRLGDVLPYAVTVDKGNTDNGFNYMIINYSQEFDPSSTAATGSNITRQELAQQQNFEWNVTRCFPAFQLGYDDHMMVAETVAISRALGVDHFVFYVERAGPRVLNMLRAMEEQGDVEVLPWNLHMEEVVLYYAGQFSAINDCLYRNLRTSRYILFGDVDELFVPRTQQSVGDLLDQQFAQNPDCGAFLFLNTFFNLHFPKSPLPTSEDNGEDFDLLKNLTMLTHTMRHTYVHPPEERSKPALDPRRVKTGSVHVVQTLREGFKSCVMNEELGLLHHYRFFGVGGVLGVPPQSMRTEDAYLWSFWDDIVLEVQLVFEDYEYYYEDYYYDDEDDDYDDEDDDYDEDDEEYYDDDDEEEEDKEDNEKVHEEPGGDENKPKVVER